MNHSLLNHRQFPQRLQIFFWCYIHIFSRILNCFMFVFCMIFMQQTMVHLQIQELVSGFFHLTHHLQAKRFLCVHRCHLPCFH